MQRSRTAVASGAAGVIVVLIGAVLLANLGDEEATGGVGDGSGRSIEVGDDEPTSTSPQVDDSASPSASAEETVAPTVVAGAAPTVEPADVTEDQPADDLAEAFVETRSKALSAPDDADQDMLFSVAEGLAFDALASTVTEYRERGWTQVGRPAVVSTKVTASEPGADPPSAVLDVCLDYTDVDVVDTAGTSVVDSDAQTRVLNVFEMEYQDGRWVLVEQGFSDDITC